MLQCPVCQSQLKLAPSKLNADLYCGECSGVWISAQKMTMLLSAWESDEQFREEGPSTDFCPECGPIPLDEGTLFNQSGLSCSSCQGFFMRQPLKAPRLQSRSQIRPHSHSKTSRQTLEEVPQLVEEFVQPIATSTHRRLTPRLTHHVNQKSNPKSVEELPETLRNFSKDSAETPSQSHRVQALKNHSKKALMGLRDLLWFGALITAIIISLIYWMNP